MDCPEKNTVLITGFTSGIGSAIARRFASIGWDILGHYSSSAEKASELASELAGKHGINATAVRADFSDPASAAAFVESVKSVRIDGLVNNAGTYIESRHYSKLDYALLGACFSVNVYAPILIASAVLPGMKERKFGRIVNISSVAAKYGGSAVSMHYGAAKRALEGVTRTLAREGAAHDVLVNTVRLGVIDTDFHKRFPKDLDARAAMVPMKRLGTPEEVAEAVVFLGSRQNTYITNTTVSVSGGE